MDWLGKPSACTQTLKQLLMSDNRKSFEMHRNMHRGGGCLL